MALSRIGQIALLVALFGALAFAFGIIAENKKPPSGTPIQGKGVVICKFPSDPSIAFGSLSVVTLAISAGIGIFGVFHQYQGKNVPTNALFSSTSLLVFFVIAVAVTVVSEGLMLWATITEALHRTQNVHQDMGTECPTAKTGLFGGAALLALDAGIFWLICLMLTSNARADYLEEDDLNGSYGQVLTTEYDAHSAAHPVA